MTHNYRKFTVKYSNRKLRKLTVIALRLKYVRMIILYHIIYSWNVITGRPLRNMRGRRNDISPTFCYECLWIGRRKDSVHTYISDGMGDVDPIDVCPKCKAEI